MKKTFEQTEIVGIEKKGRAQLSITLDLDALKVLQDFQEETGITNRSKAITSIILSYARAVEEGRSEGISNTGSILVPKKIYLQMFHPKAPAYTIPSTKIKEDGIKVKSIFGVEYCEVPVERAMTLRDALEATSLDSVIMRIDRQVALIAQKMNIETTIDIAGLVENFIQRGGSKFLRDAYARVAKEIIEGKQEMGEEFGRIDNLSDDTIIRLCDKAGDSSSTMVKAIKPFVEFLAKQLGDQSSKE